MRKRRKQNPRFVIILLVGLASAGLLGKELKRSQASSARKVMAPTARPDKAFFIHTTGDMWSSLTNYGSYGDPNSPSTGRPSAQWPGGSGNNYLYDAGLWIGGTIGGEAAVTTYFYNPDIEYLPSDGFPGELGLTVNGAKAISQEDSYMVYDDIADHTESEHKSLGFRILQRGLTWSLPEYNDFIVLEYEIVNTGLRGDLEDVFIAYWFDIDVSSTDNSEPHIDDLVDYDGWDGRDTDTDIMDVVDPFDLDGDGDTGYDEWGIPWSKDKGHNPNYDRTRSEPDGFYDEWAIIMDSDGPAIEWQTAVTNINEATGFAYTTVPGEAAVIDGDTLHGWQFPRSLSYIYDGDNPSSSGNDYGERELSPANSGFMGGLLVSTAAEMITTEQGVSYMAAYSHQWWNWESDPSDTDRDKLDYMLGKHASSLGNKYLPNPIDLGFPQFDYRFLLTTGPFDVPEGDTIRVTFAMVLGQGLQGLRENADNVFKAYYTGSQFTNPLNPDTERKDAHWILPFPPKTPELVYSPVNSGVRLVWDRTAETSIDPTLNMIDFEGYQIYRALYNPQGWEMIAAYDNLPNEAVYVVSVAGDTLNRKAVGEFVIAKGESYTYNGGDLLSWDNIRTDGQADSGEVVGIWVMEELPSIQNSFSDLGNESPWGAQIDAPLNSIPYYYVVVAYDGDKSVEEVGKDLPGVSSPMSNYKKSVHSGAPIPVYPGALYEQGDALDVQKIIVVPNPYLGSAAWEVQYEDRLKFANLPPVAKISIYSLGGDLVQTIRHTSGTDFAFWDLVSRNNQSVVSGLYIYVVEYPDVDIVGNTSNKTKQQIGKFTIFR